MAENSRNSFKKRLESLFLTYLNKNVFTGSSLVWFIKGENRNLRNFYNCGKIDNHKKADKVDDKTFFDLASLTKPLVTSLSLMALEEDKKIGFNDTLGTLLPFKMGEEKANISVQQLMNHCSGLPPHKPYFEKLIQLPESKRKNALISWILNEELIHTPGEVEVYSDLDYMLLTVIIEEISGETIEEYWTKKIIIPYGFSDDFSFSQKNDNRMYVSTGKCPWSGKELRGIVHDDNCRSLKGICGHAGLFGTALGVSKLCELILEKFIEISNINTEKRWFMGFDTPSRPLSSSGKFFSDRSIGHLGFTGTSFWIDLQKGVSIVLLTNRVYCSEDKKMIQELRPRVHDLLMKEIAVNKNYIF